MTFMRSTLASIIEKETGTADDWKKISSVFHNRLRIGMPLQSDDGDLRTTKFQR